MPRTTPWAAAAALVSIDWVGVSAAATLKVPGDFVTIQACIDAAVSGVDECVAAPGTYHETINFLGKAITVRSSGGADVTTIDATGIGGSVVTCNSGEGPDTVLDGFTITGGSAPDGGGMFNDESNPTVMNCAFTGNTAAFGGGMYNNIASPKATNCTFSGNTATNSGGGMYVYRSSAVLTDCTFTGNLALHGGGMRSSNANPTLNNCTFSRNTATNVGGGVYSEHGSPTLTHCSFSDNAGLGMYNFDSNATVTNCSFTRNMGGMFNNSLSNTTVTNCSFIGNMGGGIINSLNNTTVTNCTFRGNAATSGGGINNGYGSPTITNCAFSGNTSTRGGGMYNYRSNATVSNCVFGGNQAGEGGGMYNSGSSPTVANCVLWGDTPPETANIAAPHPSVPAIRFSDVQGGLPVGAVDGGGNIDLDPIFARPPDPGPDGMWDGVDDDYGDLRLQAGSPCIEAGDPAFVAQPGETDLEGHARVLCGRVDMGPYEFGIGDYDCDQVVDLADLSSWPACMTGPHSGPYEAGCDAFDFDADGDVDLLDFGSFQRIFGP